MINIDNIKTRIAKASPGPWDWHQNRHPNCNGTPWGWIEGPAGNMCWSGTQSKIDADFIAHARQDVPNLTAEVERLRADLEQAKKHAENLRLDYVDLNSEVERLRDENQGLKDCKDKLIKQNKRLIREMGGAERREPVVSIIPCYECGGEVIEFTVPNNIWNFVMRPDGKETNKEYICSDCWYKALRIKLEESQRRERAAIRDLEEIATGADVCGYCKNTGEQCELCGVPVQDDTSPSNFEWRGPQEGRNERNGKV